MGVELDLDSVSEGPGREERLPGRPSTGSR